MKIFSEEIERLFIKLKEGKNFAFSKYADGEWTVLKNNPVNNGEFWFTPGADSFYKNKLMQSFRFKHPEYYVGISCECCQGQEIHQQMKDVSSQDNDHLTYANIFVNSNYNFYRENFIPLYGTREVILIAHESSNVDNLPFKLEKFFPIGRNAWKENYTIIEEIKSYITENNCKNKLFLFCAGPFGNILVHQLFDFNQDNTFIDIGSTLNPFLNSAGFERDYYLPGADLSDRICIWK